MSKITCIIIEDEPLAVKILTGYIAQLPFLELKAIFRDAIQATEYLRENSPELIFLDIHLPKLKGMAFLRTLQQQPAVIITTAYHQYAVEGFDQNVTDYLLKPFDFERFLVAVNKVKAKNVAEVKTVTEEKDHFFLMVQKKMVKILFADILFIESQREYIRIVTTNGEYKSKMGTSEVEQLLPAADFRRVHRSYIISVSKIDAYTADSVEVRGNSIPVGRSFREGMEGL